MIYDIAFLITVVIFTLIGVHRRASKTLVSAVVFILSALLSAWLSRYLSGVLYDSLISGWLIEAVNEKLLTLSTNSFSSVADAAISVLPEFALTALGYFGMDKLKLTESLAQYSEEGSSQIAQSVSDLARAPFVGILSLILSAILFMAFMFLLSWLSKYVLKIFELPVVDKTDAILGGVLGFLQGLVAVFIIAVIIILLLPVMTDGFLIFTKEGISESYVLSFIQSGEFGAYVQQFTYDVKSLL